MNKGFRGFSLIELMLAATLALLLVLSISDLLLSIFRVSQGTQQKAEVAENAHYLLGLLKHDIQMAGFYGNLDLSTTIQRPDICSMPSKLSIQQALRYPVDGINNASINQRLCGHQIILPGSDILLLRQGLLSSQSMSEQLSAWKQTIYYVAEDRSFKRRRYIEDPDDPKKPKNITEPIIEGVDDFQVEYGIRYIQQQGISIEFIELPLNEQQWSQLVAIRVYLLLSSTTQSPQNHTFKTYRYGNKAIELQDNKYRGLFTGLSIINNLDPKIVVFDIEI